MASSAKQQLLKLQKSMYQRALEEARESAGVDNESISGYQVAFNESLPPKATSIPARKLLEAIDAQQIVLFGDFHSHKQSQRAFLRILRMYLNRPDHGPVIVFMEMFRTEDQYLIDDWLTGKISDHELLEAIDYDHTWGFPWNNYRPILEICKYQNLKIIGINTKRGGKDSLATRDDHAASLIIEHASKNASSKIFCMIGEFHLADTHLPEAIAKKSAEAGQKTVRVFSNVDKYYFGLDPDKIHHRDEYLSLGMRDFCVINSPPWIKWQSQSLWEEIRRLGPIKYLEDAIAPDDVEADLDTWEDDDTMLYNEDMLDLDYHLDHIQKQLSEFFKLKSANKPSEQFHIMHGNIDDDLAGLNEPASNLMLSEASIEGYSVSYASNLVYMQDVTINNLAAAAGQILFGSLAKLNEDFENDESLFVTHCLKFTFGYIANKILNPRLPMHTTRQLESYLLSAKGRRLIGSMRERRRTVQATLKLFDWIKEHWSLKAHDLKNLKRIPREFITTNFESNHELARNLAQLVAEPICRALTRGKIDTVDLQRCFQRNCENPNDAKTTLSLLIALGS